MIGKRFVVALALLVCPVSEVYAAGLFRAYLSINGKDTNPCTVAQPCRLLPAALDAIANGGEIWIVDSGNYNTTTVNITKSVTILAIPGALGSIVASGGPAIVINVALISVTLRNLNLLELNAIGDTGVQMLSGQALTVENCEFHGLGTAIDQEAASSRTMIKDTVLRDNFNGVVTGPASGSVTLDATLDSVRFSGNDAGIYARGGTRVMVTNGVFANNVTAVFAENAIVAIDRSSIAGAVANFGIQVYAQAGHFSEVFAESNTLLVGIGFNFLGGGGSEAIYSTGDNKLVYYNSVIGGTGTLTPLKTY